MLLLTLVERSGVHHNHLRHVTDPDARTEIVAMVTSLSLPRALAEIKRYAINYAKRYPRYVDFKLIAVSTIEDLSPLVCKEQELDIVERLDESLRDYS